MFLNILLLMGKCKNLTRYFPFSSGLLITRISGRYGQAYWVITIINILQCSTFINTCFKEIWTINLILILEDKINDSNMYFIFTPLTPSPMGPLHPRVLVSIILMQVATILFLVAYKQNHLLLCHLDQDWPQKKM